MDFTDCVKFATENPITFIGTMDGDQPRVRAFGMWFADKTGLYYHTSTMKDVCKQLKKNPRVELCFCSLPGPSLRSMRVTGKVEFVEGKALEERLLRDRPWMKESWGRHRRRPGSRCSGSPTVRHGSGPWR
jgi:uncharacterized pyridoxamine 5'-phosphate oxidase family protein